MGIDDDEVRDSLGVEHPPVVEAEIAFSPDFQNELAILEFIHCIVETLDRYFSNVCELDIMYNLETVRCFSGCLCLD